MAKLSFAELWLFMEQESPLMDSGEESQAVQLVRAGEELRKEDESSFWDDFLSLLSNSEGFAELLGVTPEQIMAWPDKIRQIRERLEKDKNQKPSDDEEKEVLPTGDNGAITTNQDPVM
jgi:hypothetical protein